MPHFEINYGVIPDVQIHLLLPFNYNYTHPMMNVGYASTEIGIKYRFIKETDNVPQNGGAGYWLYPGAGNKNWLFTGWETQYDFSSVITLGGELYYHTAIDLESSPSAGYNAGGFINFSSRFHFIFSAGSNLTKDHYFSSYFGLLWTI